MAASCVTTSGSGTNDRQFRPEQLWRREDGGERPDQRVAIGRRALQHSVLNAISPSARMPRMTEDLLPEAMRKYMKPELVSPAVAWMASENCNITGQIIAAAAGGYSVVQYYQSEGVQFDPEAPVTLEMFDEAFPKISDMSNAAPLGRNRSRLEERLRAMGRVG